MKKASYERLIKEQAKQYGTAKVVRAELLKRGFTIRSLAALLGCNYQTLKEILKGKTTSARVSGALEEAIQMPKGSLFGGSYAN